uniref:acyl-protein thioesterase 1-like n=1 Tax=Ciona intestinalis TaxID=7719 RepID=UPI0000523084|nr:acyl-protein thioesterase 1-like [Ciona intestinalis]|eukprot:XP_002126236.1 acyl-protein thioesterase 1-like [Ciona intestinalis]
MSVSPQFFLHNSRVPATASVIFLHGLGDTGAGWYHGFDELRKNHVRYIFPNAPSISVTMNGGFVMPAWYDLKGLGPNTVEDKKGIEASAAKIREIIKTEMDEHNIPSNRIMLGGFSMGGALALYTALTHPQQLGGVIALSSYLPLHKAFATGEGGISLTAQKCPIFQAHGTSDPMLPFQFGQMSNMLLQNARKDLNLTTEFKPYQGMGHQSCDEEMDDVKTFIDKCLQ